MSLLLAAALGLGLGLLPWRLSLGVTLAAVLAMLLVFLQLPQSDLARLLAVALHFILALWPVIGLAWAATFAARAIRAIRARRAS